MATAKTLARCTGILIEKVDNPERYVKHKHFNRLYSMIEVLDPLKWEVKQ